jgi:integrase
MISYSKKDGINYIHDYVNRIERALEKLKEINNFNSNKIIEFYKELKINGISEATQTKYLDRLITIMAWIDKDFDKVTREELINVIEENLTKRSDYSESTKRTFRIIIKRFFQWLKGYSNREYPIEVSWIRSGSNNTRKHKNPEDMLNDDDIEKMVNAVSHPRNKAFIMTLAESGCRIGEILTLTKKKICFDDKGAYFLVDGKTGTRRVRVVNSTPFLHAWLNVHPNKDDDNAPLWVNIGTTKNISDNFEEENNNYKMEWRYNMTYAAARKLLQIAAQKAGIKKPHHPHNFRHSRATRLCSLGISGNILNEYFGWTQASRSVSTYLHLSGKQVDDTLLNKAYGMQTQENNAPQSKLFPTKCFSCGQLNEPNVSRCIKCNSIIGQISNDDLEEQKTISQILKLFGGMIDKNNDIKTQFMENLKKEIMSEIKLSYQKEKIVKGGK